MTKRVVAITFAALLAAATANAQFLGDALAGAGINVSEREAGEALAASGVIYDPSLTTVSSSVPQTVPVYTPETLGKDVGLRQSTMPSVGTTPVVVDPAPAEGGEIAPLPPSEPVQIGGTSGYSGVDAYKASIDPKAAATWADAFRPVGTKLAKPPAGAIPLTVGSKSYHYAMGMFVQQAGDAWVVVNAPVGAAVPQKPVGASTVFAAKQPHTYYAGTFFVYDAKQRAYVVVAPPVGATVDYLPDSAKKVQHQGSVHYDYAGTMYKPVYRGSSVVYTVAG